MSTELDLSPYDDFLKQFSGPRPASTAPQAQPQENSWATPVRPWQPPKVEQQQVNTPQVQAAQAEPDISPYGDFIKQFSDAPEPVLQTPENSSWGSFAARNTMTLYGGLVNSLGAQLGRAGKVATSVAKPALNAIANSMSMFPGEDEGRADNSALIKESIGKTFDPAINFFERNQDTIEQVAQDKFPADAIESMPIIDKDKDGKTVYNTQLLNPFTDVGRHWLSRNVAQAGMSMAPTLALAYAGMPGAGLGLGGAMEGQSVARDAAKAGDSDAAILGKYLAMAGYVAASEKLPLDEMTKPLRNSSLWKRLQQVGLTSLIEGTQEYSEELVQNIISNADKIARGDKSFSDALREFADAARQGVNVIPGAVITGGGVSTATQAAAALQDRAVNMAEKAKAGTPVQQEPAQEQEVFNSLLDSVQAAQQERDGKQPPAGPSPTPRTDAEAQDASATVGEMVRGGTSPVDANVDQLEYELRKSDNWREMPDEDPPKVIARVAQEAGPYWRMYLDAAGGNQTLASRMYLEDVTNQEQAAQQEASEAKPVAQATPQTDVADAGPSDPRSLVATNQADAVPPTAPQADANQEPSAQQAVTPEPTASAQPVAQEPQKRTLKRAESPTMDDTANGTQTPKRTLKRPERPTVAFRGDTSTDDAIDIGEGEPVAPEQIAARIDDLDASIRTSAKIDQHTGRNNTSQRVALEDTRKRLELAFDDWKAAHPVGWQAYQQRQSGTANAKAGDTVQVPGRGTGTVVRANKRNLTVQFDGKRPELVNRAGVIVQPVAQESETATVNDPLQVAQSAPAVKESLTAQPQPQQPSTDKESLSVQQAYAEESPTVQATVKALEVASVAGVSIGDVKPTGANGTVTVKDVQDHIAAPERKRRAFIKNNSVTHEDRNVNLEVFREEMKQGGIEPPKRTGLTMEDLGGKYPPGIIRKGGLYHWDQAIQRAADYGLLPADASPDMLRTLFVGPVKTTQKLRVTPEDALNEAKKGASAVNEAEIEPQALVYMNDQWYKAEDGPDGGKSLKDGEVVSIGDFEGIDVQTLVQPGDDLYDYAFEEYAKQEQGISKQAEHPSPKADGPAPRYATPSKHVQRVEPKTTEPSSFGESMSQNAQDAITVYGSKEQAIARLTVQRDTMRKAGANVGPVDEVIAELKGGRSSAQGDLFGGEQRSTEPETPAHEMLFNPNETRKEASEQDVSREHGQNEADPQAARRETARVTEAGEQKADEGAGAEASRAGNGGGVSAQLDQLDDSAAYGDDEAASDEGDRMELPERETKDPDEHEVWLTLYASGRPMSSDEIASKAMDPESMGTMNRKRVDKAIERMVSSGFLEERDGKYWAAQGNTSQTQDNTSQKSAPKALGKNGKKASAIERAQAAAPNALETRTVQDESELPEHVQDARKSLSKNAKVRAVYDPKTNTVWLVLGRLKDASDALTAWVHEQVGHAGMRAIMTAKEHARMLRSIVTTVGSENLRAMFPAYTGLTDAQLADEYIAKLSEDIEREGRLGGKQRTVWEKILGYVRRAMNALGLRQSLTKTAARDIQETVRRAAEYVRGQSTGTGPAESGSGAMFSAEEQDNPFEPVDVYAGLPWRMARDMANDTADAFDSAIMGDSGTDSIQDKLTGQPESSQYRIIRSWQAKNPASTAVLGKILKEDAEHAQYGSHTFYLPAEDVSTNKVKRRGPIVVRDSKPDGVRVRPVLINMAYTHTVDMAGRDLSDAQISESVKENEGEFSTLLFTNVGNAKENVGVVFSPEHVKSGEVITADKDGQIIEDRFQEDDSDIRFSATQDAEPEVKARRLIDRLRAVVPNASARQKAVFTGVVSAAIAEGVREGRDMRVGKDAQEIFKIVLRNMKDTYNRDSDLPKLAGILGEWRNLLNNISADSNVEDPFERSRIIRKMMQDYFGSTFDRVFAASDSSPDALLREMEIAWGNAVSHYYGRALARLITYNPRDLWNDTENPLREKWLALSEKYKEVVDLKKKIAKMSAFIRKERDAGSTPAVIEALSDERQKYRDELEKKLQSLPPKEIESTFLALQELREKSKVLQQALQFEHDVERTMVAEDIESTVYQSTDEFASKGAIRKFISYVGKALDGLQNIAEVIGAFDHKSKAYEYLWTRFRSAEDSSNKLYTDTMQKLRDKLASLGVSGMKLAEWANDTITADFGKIKKQMTTMELMTLYAYTKDPDAYEKVLRNGMVVKRDKGMGYSWKAEKNDIEHALSALTDEQRAIVDTMMSALKAAARHADKASMRMFGHEIFYAPEHWHIEVDRSQSDLVLNVDDVGQMNDMQLLQNMGLAKERVEHRHPLVLGNAMSTFAMEARYLSNFAHLAEATLDAIRIVGKSNVGIALRRQFGNGYYKHVTKAIVDAGRANRHVEGKSTLKRILSEIEAGIAVNAVGFRATSYLKNLLSGSIPAFTEAYRISPKAAALFAKLHATSAGEVLDKKRRQRYLDAREKLNKNGFLQARWTDGFTATFSSVPRTTEELSSMVKELLPAKVQNLSVPMAKTLHVKRVVSEKSMSWMRNAEQRIGANLYLAFRDSGMSEEDALSSVEEVIRNTQNPSSRIDEGGIYTAWKSSDLSMFGMFLGQPMTQANLLRRDLYRALYFNKRGTKQEADAAAHQVYRTALGLAASTVVSVGINALFAIAAKGTFGAIWNALTGQGDDEDKKKAHIQAVRSLSQMFGEALDDFIPGTGRFVDASAKALDSMITAYENGELDLDAFFKAASTWAADTIDSAVGENALQGVRYDSMFMTDLMKDSAGERLGGVARAMKFAGSVGVPVSGPMQLIGAASGTAGYPLGQEWEAKSPAGRRTLRRGTPRTLRQGQRRTLKSSGPVRRLRNR